MARPGLWLCWLVLAFGLMNVYGPRPDAAPPPGSPPAQPASVLETVLNLQRDGRDIERYFAYANALLGRPCVAKYIQLTDDAKDIATSVVGDTLTPSRPLRPWRDFAVEYPPGMLIPVALPALFTTNFDTYFFLFSLEMEAVLTLAVALAARTAEALTPGGGRRALGLSIVLTAALGCVAVRRYDACVALAIAAVVYGMATRRPIVACVALAIGVALKGVPLLMAPALLFWFVGRRDWRALAVGAASAALCLGAVVVAYVAIAGPHVLDLFRYHSGRPLQLETPYAGVLLILAPRFPNLFSVTYSYGSDNLASAAEPWLRNAASLLEIVALVVICAVAYLRIRRAADDRQRFTAAAWAFSAVLVAFMSLGKVFSAQYLVWLLPLGAIAGATASGRSHWRLVAANGLTQAEFPFLYSLALGDYPALAPLLGLAIVARALALWSWIAEPIRQRTG